MARVTVRGLEQRVVDKLDELAAQAGRRDGRKVSREEYLRRYINHLAAMEEVEEAVKSIEGKYNRMIKELQIIIEENTDVIERNNRLLLHLLEGGNIDEKEL